MAAVEALAGRQGIGSRVSEGLRTVFPKRRELPTYSPEAVMEALGPHVDPTSRFAQEMTDFRQGDPPDLSDLAKGTMVRVAVGVGIVTAVSLAAGCAPHIFPDGGGGVPDGGAAPTDGSGGATPPSDPVHAWLDQAWADCGPGYDEIQTTIDHGGTPTDAQVATTQVCVDQYPGAFDSITQPTPTPDLPNAFEYVIYGRPVH